MTTRDFLNTGYEFSDAVSKALKRSDKLCGRKAKPIRKHTYIEVNEYKERISKNDIIGVMADILGVSVKTILKIEHTDFVYFAKWLEDEFVEITELEKKLITEPKSEMIEAGIDDLQKFGIMNVVKALSNNQIWKQKEVENTEWERVYVTLLINKTESEIQENLQEIYKRKRK